MNDRIQELVRKRNQLEAEILNQEDRIAALEELLKKSQETVKLVEDDRDKWKREAEMLRRGVEYR